MKGTQQVLVERVDPVHDGDDPFTVYDESGNKLTEGQLFSPWGQRMAYRQLCREDPRQKVTLKGMLQRGG